MLGIEYFGNLEHYCFKKNVISDFFSWSVTSPKMSYIFRGKLWSLANDVIIVYFWLSEFFLLRFFCLFGIFWTFFYWNSLENIFKVDYNWHLTSATFPTSRFPVHISLNRMFHCNARHSYDLDGLKSKFIVWHIIQVFLIMGLWLCRPSAQK